MLASLYSRLGPMFLLLLVMVEPLKDGTSKVGSPMLLGYGFEGDCGIVSHTCSLLQSFSFSMR